MKKLELDIFEKKGAFRAEGFIEIVTEDGCVELPVFVIQGGDGPRLTAVGAQHSCEYCGTDALIKLIGELRQTDPAELAGSLVLIPVANVPGFPVRANCVSQYDGTNLNRSYPGSPTGNTSERIAHTIWTIVQTGDYALDLHGGDINEDVIQYAEMHIPKDPAVLEKSLGMAACFDLDVVLTSIAGQDYAYPDFRSLYGLAQDNGIPASIVEAGGAGRSDPAGVDYFYRGLKKVMDKVGVTRGTPPQKRKLWTTRFVSCIERPGEGIFVTHVKAGDRVERGQLMGVVTDYLGDEIDRIEAPRTGIVSLSQSCRGKGPDDLIYMVIDLEDGAFVEV